MKIKLSFLAVATGLALVAAGCSTASSRASRQPDFANWPPVVQRTVLAGKIDIGFTREQVSVALGAPDYSYTRATADGTSEIWSYRDRGPRFSFGVGLGSASMHGRTAVGTGVSIGTNTSRYPDEKVRVVFDRTGQVATVEEATRR